DAILSSRPHRTVASQKRRPRAFFATEREPSGEQPIDEPLEAHGNFVQAPSQLRGNTIDHAAADHGLSNRRILAPAGSILEKVIHANRQVVIGSEQAGTASN